MQFAQTVAAPARRIVRRQSATLAGVSQPFGVFNTEVTNPSKGMGDLFTDLIGLTQTVDANLTASDIAAAQATQAQAQAATVQAQAAIAAAQAKAAAKPQGGFALSPGVMLAGAGALTALLIFMRMRKRRG